jgi:hypothetical protein
MRWLAIAVAVLGLALVGAGCGGDDEEAASDDTTVTMTTETETTDTGETTDEGTTDDTLGGFDFDDEDCRELADTSSAIGQLFAAPGSELDESDAFEQFADRVPDEIRDDYQVLADAFAEYREALADLDIGQGETPTAEDVQAIVQALSSIDQAAVSEATQNISAWVTENCTG